VAHWKLDQHQENKKCRVAFIFKQECAFSKISRFFQKLALFPKTSAFQNLRIFQNHALREDFHRYGQEIHRQNNLSYAP
jgi:hypothetical protein